MYSNTTTGICFGMQNSRTDIWFGIISTFSISFCINFICMSINKTTRLSKFVFLCMGTILWKLYYRNRMLSNKKKPRASRGFCNVVANYFPNSLAIAKGMARAGTIIRTPQMSRIPSCESPSKFFPNIRNVSLEISTNGAFTPVYASSGARDRATNQTMEAIRTKIHNFFIFGILKVYEILSVL